jgi:Zn-dependent protease
MHVLAWFIPFFQGLLLGVIAMAFHEAGHLIAAPLVGIKIKTVGLRWKGLYTVREAGPPDKNMIVSLAGPLVNLALIATWHWSFRFGLANLCFTFFNLLPIEGSDGERVWRCWRAMKRERLAPVDGSAGGASDLTGVEEKRKADYAVLANDATRSGD